MGQLCCKHEVEPISFNVLLLGLENSGKTEVGYTLIGKKRESFEKTNGVKLFTRQYSGITLNLTEVGGSADMQKIWHHYFVKTMAVIFCYDMSADFAGLLRAFKALEDLMGNRFLQGKPFLVVATKSDLAADGIQLYDIENTFYLDLLSNRYQTHIRSVYYEADNCISFKNGVDWLDNFLAQNYRRLINTIKYDTEIALAESHPVKNEKREENIFTRTFQSLRRNSSTIRPHTAPLARHRRHLNRRNATHELTDFDPYQNLRRPKTCIALQTTIAEENEEEEASTSAGINASKTN